MRVVCYSKNGNSYYSNEDKDHAGAVHPRDDLAATFRLHITHNSAAITPFAPLPSARIKAFYVAPPHEAVKKSMALDCFLPSQITLSGQRRLDPQSLASA